MHNAAEFITACKKLKVPEQKVLIANTCILLVLHLPTVILFSLLPNNHCTAKLLMTENCLYSTKSGTPTRVIRVRVRSGFCLFVVTV